MKQEMHSHLEAKLLVVVEHCLVALALLLTISGCGSQTTRSAGGGGAIAPLNIQIYADGQSGNVLNIMPGQPASIQFHITGAPSPSAVSIALAQMPAGSTLSTGTLDPVFSWPAPMAQPTSQLVILVRDLNACTAALGNASACLISQSQWGSITTKYPYDTVQTFSFSVMANAGTPTLGQVGGLGAGMPSTGNGTLIQKIMQMAGGLGQTPTGSTSGLSSLLSTLSSGQLTSLLSGLSNGGSLSTLLSQIVGNMGLTAPAPQNAPQRASGT